MVRGERKNTPGAMTASKLKNKHMIRTRKKNLKRQFLSEV